MGPIVEPSFQRLVLRPYSTSHTCRNLRAHGEGVFHVTDDVLLLAQAAVGMVQPQPELCRAMYILGYYLPSACRYYEFRVTRVDDRNERITFEAEVLHAETLRDFFGFNRAKHAVLEAAILATRTALLPMTEIEAEYEKLGLLVEKTGGDAEREAFAHLRAFVAQAKEKQRP
jgi:hypothetical protein